jgi:hypothetical protein
MYTARNALALSGKRNKSDLSTTLLVKLLAKKIITIHVFWDITPCRALNSYRRFGERAAPIFRV